MEQKQRWDASEATLLSPDYNVGISHFPLFIQRNHYQCTLTVARYRDSASHHTHSQVKSFPPPLHWCYRFRLDLYPDYLIPLDLTDHKRLTDTAKSIARRRGLLTFPYLRSDTLVD